MGFNSGFKGLKVWLQNVPGTVKEMEVISLRNPHLNNVSPRSLESSMPTDSHTRFPNEHCTSHDTCRNVPHTLLLTTAVFAVWRRPVH